MHCTLTLKVPSHEIFLLQNMLLINAFIKVAFLFFSSLFRKFGLNPKFPKSWSLKLGMDFLVFLKTFSIDFYVALNTIA